MSTSSSTSERSKRRGMEILFGPPGLFLGLTLTVLVAGGFVGQTTAAPRPRNETSNALPSVRNGARQNFEKSKKLATAEPPRFVIAQEIDR
jgi:hypothetical protein